MGMEAPPSWVSCATAWTEARAWVTTGAEVGEVCGAGSC